MCRLALMNREGIKLAENNYRGGIEVLFDCLENSFGGHGNGYAIFYDNKKIKVKKNVILTNNEIATDILKNLDNIEYVIYHTRLASVGNVNNVNCHPFKIGYNVLAMNGTESWAKPFIAKNETDTETILKIATELDKNLIEVCSKLGSVFVGAYAGKVFATHGRGDLELLQSGKGLIFASEFPTAWYKGNIKIYDAPKTWIEGEKIDIKRLREIKIKATASKVSYVPIRYQYQHLFIE